jgi:hypothetical protein
MPESGFLQPASTASASNPMFHGQPVPGQLPDITASASGAGHHGQRITGRGMFQGINGRRGAAGLTG